MNERDLILAAMAANGFNQAELADELKATRSAVSDWLRDKRTPDPRWIEPLCILAGIDPMEGFRIFGFLSRGPTSEDLGPPTRPPAPLPAALLTELYAMNDWELRVMLELARGLRREREALESDGPRPPQRKRRARTSAAPGTGR